MLSLRLGGIVQAYAPLVSGSGTDALTFRYTVGPGSTSSGNGIVVAKRLVANGATLADGTAQAASLRLLADDTTVPGVVVDGQAPTVASFTHDGDLGWTLTFDGPVTGVDASDFDVVGTGSAAAQSVTVDAVDAATYRVTLHGASGSGSLAPRLKDAGTGIADRAGNPLAAGVAGEPYALPEPPVVVTAPPAVTTPPSVTQPQPAPPVVVRTRPSLRTATIATTVHEREDAAADARRHGCRARRGQGRGAEGEREAARLLRPGRAEGRQGRRLRQALDAEVRDQPHHLPPRPQAGRLRPDVHADRGLTAPAAPPSRGASASWSSARRSGVRVLTSGARWTGPALDPVEWLLPCRPRGAWSGDAPHTVQAGSKDGLHEGDGRSRSRCRARKACR